MSESPESAFIDTEILRMEGELATVPHLIRKEQHSVQIQIEELLEKAEILHQVKELENRKEEIKTRITSQRDQMQGALIMLNQIKASYHTATPPTEDEVSVPAPPPFPSADELVPLPPGTTHMHGVDLTKLDAPGRAQVMSGNQEVIDICLASQENGPPEDTPEMEEAPHEEPDPEDVEGTEFMGWVEDDVDSFPLDEEETPHLEAKGSDDQVRSLLERYNTREMG